MKSYLTISTIAEFKFTFGHTPATDATFNMPPPLSDTEMAQTKLMDPPFVPCPKSGADARLMYINQLPTVDALVDATPPPIPKREGEEVL
jgi:hypothetical protein